LNDHDVRYVVIGGIAAIVHGVPRATFDVDLLIEASENNAERLLAALESAGLATAGMTTPTDVLAHEITVFRDRVRVDVQTATPGVLFADAWDRKVTREISGVSYHLVCRDDLLRTKRAAGRPRDLEDVAVLEEQNDQSDG